MAATFQQFEGTFFCPDDRQPLSYELEHFHCRTCRRHFPIFDRRLLEILPSCPTPLQGEVAASYANCYLEEFTRSFAQNERALAWGAVEKMPAGWFRKRQRQVAAMWPLVQAGEHTADKVLCDVSGDAGNYTFSYAHHFKAVIHCDISVDALNYALNRARQLHSDNVLFVRMDYVRPPFRHSLDRIICFDTLIRGRAHELMLLAALRNCLLPDGKAVVDFHNWGHNPLRRIGLLPQNFGDNRSYTRRSAETLLHSAGFKRFDYSPFAQEVEPHSRSASLLQRLLPATRLVYRLSPVV